MQPVNTFPHIFSVFGHTFVNIAQRQHSFLVTFDTQKMHAHGDAKIAVNKEKLKAKAVVIRTSAFAFFMMRTPARVILSGGISQLAAK